MTLPPTPMPPPPTPPQSMTWKQVFARCVSRARDAVRRATPLLTVEDNVPCDFRLFEEAQRHMEGITFADVCEFICTSSAAVSSEEAGPGPSPQPLQTTADAGAGKGKGAAHTHTRAPLPPTLLVLAGMVECLARGGGPAACAAQVVRMLQAAGCAGLKVRVQMWLLGRLVRSPAAHRRTAIPPPNPLPRVYDHLIYSSSTMPPVLVVLLLKMKTVRCTFNPHGILLPNVPWRAQLPPPL